MNNPSEGRIIAVNGPVIKIDEAGLFAGETVLAGPGKLSGEVISVAKGVATAQVYEDTGGLIVGDPAVGLGHPLSQLLGPGLLGNIFDGIGRPLKKLAAESGKYIKSGTFSPSIPEDKAWSVSVAVKEGDSVSPGTIYARCAETPIVEHRFIVPSSVFGKVVYAAPDGEYKINDTVVRVLSENGAEHELKLCAYWPVRKPRPALKRLRLSVPLVTGQRVVDTLFPIAKGGSVAVPGGFGTGKTMTQHQLAKWCDADIIVYIGCGERGNEMTQVLEEFSHLVDPVSGKPLTERTITIANTSNMPVAARETSIYTGMTIAEYYRDMGYHVALFADSTSRWAEALREISGRLEEMPAEEGYPAYLASRLAGFYERAGYFETLGGAVGSITVIGAVSPQGGDLSEPVTQNTKRFVRAFLALDRGLAYSRHYPAVNWNISYSDYTEELEKWYGENVSPDFIKLRGRIMSLLSEEARLLEIVRLIGGDMLPDDKRLIMDTARVIRLGFLQQNAFSPIDCRCPFPIQLEMMKTIIHLYDQGRRLIAQAIPIQLFLESGIFDRVIRMKYDKLTPESKKNLRDEITAAADRVISDNTFKE